jgi:hypothetical protein
VRFGISSIRDIEPVGGIPAVLEEAEDEDESPRTRERDGKVNVLECPFPLDEADGPSSLIVSSFALSLSLSLSLSGFLRKGRASDGNLRNVEVDVDVDADDVVVEGGVGTGDEVVETGVRTLPKGGSLSAMILYCCSPGEIGLGMGSMVDRRSSMKYIPLESILTILFQNTLSPDRAVI